MAKEPKENSRLGTASNKNYWGLQLVCGRPTLALSSKSLWKFERTSSRLINFLYFSAVYFLISIKTFFTGQMDEQYPKNGDFVSLPMDETLQPRR